MLLAGGSRGNLHILSLRCEELHEAFHGKGSGAVAHERRDVGLLDTQDLSSFGLLKAASFNKPYDSRDAAIALHRTTDSSLASPSQARLRTSLGMTKVCRALVFCTLALLRPQWHGKDSRFLARLAEQNSACDVTGNDEGLRRARILNLRAAAAAVARQG